MPPLWEGPPVPPQPRWHPEQDEPSAAAALVPTLAATRSPVSGAGCLGWMWGRRGKGEPPAEPPCHG